MGTPLKNLVAVPTSDRKGKLATNESPFLRLCNQRKKKKEQKGEGKVDE